MKFIIRFYFLPFLIGVIVSIFLWISSFDSKLRVEGLAKLKIHHNLTTKTSVSFWDSAINKMTAQFKNESLMITEKRGFLRFYSKNNDIEEIKKNYQIAKTEMNKYKKEYLDLYILSNKVTLDDMGKAFERRKKIENNKNATNSKKQEQMRNITLEIKKKEKLLNYLEYRLNKKEFLGDLKTHEVVIRNFQIIYIILLISFFFTIILYNIKKLKAY